MNNSVKLWIKRFLLNILNTDNTTATNNAIVSGIKTLKAISKVNTTASKNQIFHNDWALNLTNNSAIMLAMVIVMNIGMNEVFGSKSGLSILYGSSLPVG